MNLTNLPTGNIFSPLKDPNQTNHKPYIQSNQSLFINPLKSPRPSTSHLHTDRPNKTIDSSFHECSKGQSLTPRSSSIQEHLVKKPISLAILEKYFSDICQSITLKNSIDQNLLSKAETMHGVLKDCLTAIHDMSLEIYILMASALKDIQQIRMTNDIRYHSLLMNKLLQISAMIEDNAYRSQKEKASICEDIKDEKSKCIEDENEDIGKELNIRVSRVTARILNIWKKIVCPQKEAGIVCCGFLLLYCEVDPTIKVSPLVKIRFDKAVVLMKNYTANPGYVVTVIRKTKEYIENEQISIEAIRRIHDMLGRITPEEVKNMDRTMTGFVLYELLVYSVKYYEKYAKEKYNLDIYVKDSVEDNEKEKDVFGESQITGRVTDRKAEKIPLSRAAISPNRVKVVNSSFSPSKNTPKKMISSQASLKSQRSSKNLTPTRGNSTQLRKTPIIHHSPSKSSIRVIEQNTPKPFQRTFSPGKLVKTLVKSPSKSIDTKRKPFSNTIRISPPKNTSSNTASPLRNRISINISHGHKSIDHRDVLEEMQYQQFIEEKFRSFLVDKLNHLSLQDESFEAKLECEDKAMKNRERWMKEFENNVGVIRFNAIKKLCDERRFTAELIRAQRQMEMLDTPQSNYVR
ncbi:hypothetical protein SteCoe_25902 [Stentor coeruleus]|uniref:Uncharacterized protein n=1 Tax=Stentor coeruleus TaxID=5963 RepID=A0A1R2BE67_9CILI|nr:hypothetical protein SteCoe_25902 [Stentor coeruleus]